jgi:hypothetical protein
MNLEKLHNAIAAVCPIIGVSIGNVSDKTTWIFTATVSATTEEIAAAQAIINAADTSILNDPVYYTPQEFKNKFTTDEQDAILASEDAQVKRIWFDFATAITINVEHQDTISAMTYLVAVGLLTEARKAEVLS